MHKIVAEKKWLSISPNEERRDSPIRVPPANDGMIAELPITPF